MEGWNQKPEAEKEHLRSRCEPFVDATRSTKAQGSDRSRFASALLTLAAMEALFSPNGYTEQADLGKTITRLTVVSLLEKLEENREQAASVLPRMTYTVSEKGKPSWSDKALPAFNLSHSEEGICVVLSQTEVGVDLQMHKAVETEKIATRFFAPEEVKMVAAGGLPAFYRIWARKEAYTKMRGISLGEVLPMDLSHIEKQNDHIKFSEMTISIGEQNYSLAVCEAIPDEKVNA